MGSVNGALAHPSCICVANNRKLSVDCLQSLSCRYLMHGSLTIVGDRLQFTGFELSSGKCFAKIFSVERINAAAKRLQAELVRGGAVR